ncbi:hypothetical protein FPV67DRAFT_1728420 [Lyophyllum atratum]|nr:hypothetical protein FPV67DRAFT_1728420 [Lyophyllum atratum]
MSYTIRKLIDPTPEQIEEVRAVFDAAFAIGKLKYQCHESDNSTHQHHRISPTERAFESVVGPTQFHKILPLLNRAQLVAGSLAGEMFIAEDASNKVIGAIIWFGPGREMYDSDDQRKLALGPLMEHFPAEAKEWYASTGPKMEAFKKRVFGDLAQTEWYLQRIGVHPDWQGKGVGTALIEHGRKLTDGHGIALQAVEPVNVSYYEHLGFKKRGHIDVQALHGDFTVTGLLWEP